MKTIKYNKLVRDKIPAIIRADGAKSRTRKLEDPNEYLSELIRKLHEETDEFKESLTLAERADIQAVINAIDAELGFTAKQIEAEAVRKEAERGGFSKRIFLAEVVQLD